MKTYIVKYKQDEKVFTDVQFAVSEAERIGQTGVTTYVFIEVDGAREEEPFFSCEWSA